MVAPAITAFVPRRTEIRWFNPDYGQVDFGNTGLDERDLSHLSGKGQVVDSESSATRITEIERRIEAVERGLLVYHDFATADVDVTPLDEWVQVGGLQRTYTSPIPAAVLIWVRLRLETDELSAVADGDFLARFTVNDEELGGRTKFSLSSAKLLLDPDVPDRIQVTLYAHTVVWIEPGTAYDVQVEVMNTNGETPFAVGVGDAGNRKDSSMMSLVVPQPVDQRGTIDESIPPKPEATFSWSRILDFAYDAAHDEIAVARIRAEFDDGVPPVVDEGGGSYSGPWEQTPDRAFFEIAYFSRASLEAAPPTSTLGGVARYKRELADPALWQDFYSVAFGASAESGAVAWALSAAEAGPTADSQKFYLVIAGYGGQEYVFESWDGPDWYDDANPYYATGLYGCVAWGGANDDAYLIVPTDDTAAASGGDPYKSGWRIWVRNGIGGSYSGAAKGAEQSSDDILPDGGNEARLPITLTVDGSDVRFWWYEILTSIDRRIYSDLLVAPGGESEYEFGGYIPPTGESIEERWAPITAPKTYVFQRQGFLDIYSITGSSNDPNDLTLLSDDYYNGGLYDEHKLELYKDGPKMLLFVRGAQGAEELYYDDGGIGPLAEPWLVFAVDESAP